MNERLEPPSGQINKSAATLANARQPRRCRQQRKNQTQMRRHYLIFSELGNHLCRHAEGSAGLSIFIVPADPAPAHFITGGGGLGRHQRGSLLPSSPSWETCSQFLGPSTEGDCFFDRAARRLSCRIAYADDTLRYQGQFDFFPPPQQSFTCLDMWKQKQILHVFLLSLQIKKKKKFMILLRYII